MSFLQLYQTKGQNPQSLPGIHGDVGNFADNEKTEFEDAALLSASVNEAAFEPVEDAVNLFIEKDFLNG